MTSSQLDAAVSGRIGGVAIALFVDRINLVAGGYEQEMRNAFHQQCQACGANLHVVYGRALEASSPETLAHNAIFDCIGPDSVQGIIVLSSSLSSNCGVEGLHEFLRRFEPLARVSVGMDLAGVPSVVVDGSNAVGRLVEHLVRVHGRRRLAFIGGVPNNPEAISRLRGYTETLERLGLARDPELVSSGHFVRSGGEAAIRSLVDRGIAFDSVVAANDSMAFGAMDALRSLAQRIGEQVPLTGFDDLAAACVCNPPLTTANQPFAKVAEAAVRLILDQIAGFSVPGRVDIPAEVVFRRSCGCSDAHEATAGRNHGGARAAEYRLDELQRFACSTAICSLIEGAVPDAADTTACLVRAFELQLGGDEQALSRVVQDIIEQGPGEAGRILALDRVVRRLRVEDREPVNEALWHGLRDILARSASAAHMHFLLELHATDVTLQATNEHLSGVLEMPALAGELERCLSLVGASTAVVARVVDELNNGLALMVCVRNGVSVREFERAATCSEMFAAVAPADGCAQTLLVFPIVMGPKCIGVAAFAYQPEMRAYTQLRDQIAGAMRNVVLHDSLVEEKLLHERSAQERLATANRLQAMSLLAGSVAHDLNNALGPMVALPDILVSDLDQLTTNPEKRVDFVADLETIRSASIRAAQIVKDLLTLGRQGRTPKLPLDLNGILDRCIESDVARLQRVEHANFRLVADLAPQPIFVLGSETQLCRAVFNLIHNAAESVRANGLVSVTSRIERLEQSVTSYERIEPGTYAVLRIADNGIGIAAPQLPRIFEPYFTSKRASNESGTGLGLAIVHGVVKEHDGYIDVMSTVGRGTTFALYIPTTEERPTSSLRCTPVPVPSARIWAVDDDPVQLRTARRVLLALGYEVDTFDCGAAVLGELRLRSQLGRPPCDLMLLDMCLGERADGLGLLDQVRAICPQQRAMIVSGFAAPERAKLADYQGLAWLLKPYTTATLGAAIVAALR